MKYQLLNWQHAAQLLDAAGIAWVQIELSKDGKTAYAKVVVPDRNRNNHPIANKMTWLQKRMAKSGAIVTAYSISNAVMTFVVPESEVQS